MDAKLLCLGALTCGDASGYEIKKMFEEGPFAYFHQVSFGSIYPSLAKLCDEGLIDMREESQDGRPDKKVYSLTESGKEELRRGLSKKPANDQLRSEAVAMFFLHNFMEPRHLRDVFEQQLSYYRSLLDRVDSLDDTDIPAQRMFVRGLGRTYYRSVVDYMEENAHMLLGEGYQPNRKIGTDL